MNDLEKEQIQSRATNLTGVKMVDRIKSSVNAFKEKDNVQVKCVSLNKPNC